MRQQQSLKSRSIRPIAAIISLAALALGAYAVYSRIKEESLDGMSLKQRSDEAQARLTH